MLLRVLLKVLNFAPTLGDVGTTISHPASSSHRALTAEQRADLGISEGFFSSICWARRSEKYCVKFLLKQFMLPEN